MPWTIWQRMTSETVSARSRGFPLVWAEWVFMPPAI
jgi:hypothetical protein